MGYSFIGSNLTNTTIGGYNVIPVAGIDTNTAPAINLNTLQVGSYVIYTIMIVDTIDSANSRTYRITITITTTGSSPTGRWACMFEIF